MKKITFDKLQMFFGMPYVVDIEGVKGVITITQPTLRLLVEFGEKRFYSNLNPFVSNTTTHRLPLWEAGVDWNEITNFDLFCILYQSVEDEFAEMIFGEGFSFSSFELYEKSYDEENKEVVLYSKELDVEINAEVYDHISQYLQSVFKIFPEEKKTKDATLKRWFIQKDERELEIQRKKEAKGEIESPSILPLISACLNHSGFKYNSKQILDINIYEFYDSVQRLQLYESATAVMKGMFSGFVDTSKIKPDEYNFMKDI